MPSQEAIRLAQKLAALPELPMRTHVLIEYLERAELPEAVLVLDEIQAQGRKGGPPFDIAMLALAKVLSQQMLRYGLLKEIFAEAKATDRQGLMQLFYSSKGDPTLPQPRNERRREYTLGHRKWLARDTRRDVLDRLLRDPEPEVMPNLLRNPRITEPDIIRVAARRPIDPAILCLIFDSSRWITRYSIKRTLVLNPYTPTEISIRLLRFMMEHDIKLVRSMSNLPQVLQQAAARMLALPPDSC